MIIASPATTASAREVLLAVLSPDATTEIRDDPTVDWRAVALFFAELIRGVFRPQDSAESVVAIGTVYYLVTALADREAATNSLAKRARILAQALAGDLRG